MKKYINYLLVCILLITLSCSDGRNNGGDSTSFQYHTPDEVNLLLEETVANYPAITKVVNIGTSFSGRDIKAIIISDNPDDLEGEPAIRLTGGIHGDEMISVEILIRFIEYLTSNYNSTTDTSINTLINSRYICIIPVMNPDGLASQRRYNDNDVDLNRNFNDTGNHWTAGSGHGSEPFSEPETQAIVSFSSQIKFSLSITYHQGAVLVNLPFDYGSEINGTYPVENVLVEKYAKAYTNAGTFLLNPDLYEYEPYMDEGTINGGNWYIANGSLQDWSYTNTGCLDLTVEVADYNPTKEEGVQQVYIYNRDSLITYINKAGEGIYGMVTDNKTPPVPLSDVTITVKWDDGGTKTGDLVIKTDSAGYYNRILLEGTYDITFSKSGYTSQTINKTLASAERSLVDIKLIPE